MRFILILINQRGFFQRHWGSFIKEKVEIIATNQIISFIFGGSLKTESNDLSGCYGQTR